MTVAFRTLMNGYASSVTRPGEWLRRVAVVGCGEDEEGALLVDAMSDMAAGLLDLPRVFVRFRDAAMTKPADKSVVVGAADTSAALRRAFGLAVDDHHVIVATQDPEIADAAERLRAAAVDPRGLNALFSRLSFVAAVRPSPQEFGLKIGSHVVFDAKMQAVLMESRPGRWPSVIGGALCLERHRRRLSDGRSIGPLGEAVARALSDSPNGRNMPE